MCVCVRGGSFSWGEAPRRLFLSCWNYTDIIGHIKTCTSLICQRISTGDSFKALNIAEVRLIKHLVKSQS